MTTTTTASDTAHAAGTESVLPELRTMWWETGIQARATAGVWAWETGIQARATAGVWAVFTELPRWVRAAVAISWRADRARTLVVAAATVTAGLI